jgi:predicted nucleic acid-binding protein
MSVVLDASAALDLVLGLKPRLALQLVGEDLHVPMTFDVEVASALRRLELSGVLPTAQIDAAMARVSLVAVARHSPVPHLLDACWEWRHNITIQDGVYVALAHLLRAPLATTDDRLARAAGDLIQLIQ